MEILTNDIRPGDEILGKTGYRRIIVGNVSHRCGAVFVTDRRSKVHRYELGNLVQLYSVQSEQDLANRAKNPPCYLCNTEAVDMVGDRWVCEPCGFRLWDEELDRRTAQYSY